MRRPRRGAGPARLFRGPALAAAERDRGPAGIAMPRDTAAALARSLQSPSISAWYARCASMKLAMK